MAAEKRGFTRTIVAGLILTIGFAAVVSAQTIEFIDFFGTKGVDVAGVRAALPVKQGDRMPERAERKALKQRVSDAVRASTGHSPTDVALVCCTEHGGWMIYVGLPGTSSAWFQYLKQPVGVAPDASEMVALSKSVDAAGAKLAERGGQAMAEGSREDDSRGYALAADPGIRALQMKMREYALAHEARIVEVLTQSPRDEDRRAAAELLGYARQSAAQVGNLARASRDADDEVRNNAVRALSVLARVKSKYVKSIPAGDFIAMLRSGIWTDRNKAAALLDELTASGDAGLRVRLRAEAMDALTEMAAWQDGGHASFAQSILGRLR